MSTADRLAELKRQREAADPQAHAEARAERRQRTEEMKIALMSRDLEQELAEIQEHEHLTRALQEDTRTIEEEQLKRADLAATEAIAYVYKLRRDIFLQEREARNSQLALNHRQLALNHEGRVRAECERVERAATVAPVEYVLGDLPYGQSSVRYYRVLLGECNVTFSIVDAPPLTRKQWEFQHRKTAPLWRLWNPLKGQDVPQIDLDFQDDVFILPHFREEIATHLESQSMIHTAIDNTFFLSPSSHSPWKLDASFEVTLKFLARMKKFNRLEFATISCAL